MIFKIVITCLVAAGLCLASGCKTTTEGLEGHNVSKGGVNHMAGLNDPETNCVSCHGADLTGMGNAPSCFKCHGKKW